MTTDSTSQQVSKYSTVPKRFLDAVDKFANPRAQMYRAGDGAQPGGWQTISAKELLQRVAALAKALVQLGLRSGDRVGVFAPNCPEWHVADFAIQGVGGVVVPIYFRESPDRLTYILKDSGARFVFTSGEPQAREIAACRAQLPELENMISAGRQKQAATRSRTKRLSRRSMTPMSPNTGAGSPR